jgi:hypothetical protein
MQAGATIAIDMNRTHATNPLWPTLARFHPVWQGVLSAFLASAAILAFPTVLVMVALFRN